MKFSRQLKAFILVLAIVVLDQITKILALSYNTDQRLIPGILELEFIKNTGAGFGILSGQNLILAWLGLIVIGAILFFYNNIEKDLRLPLMIVLAGIIGNTIDRFVHGFVIDFIAFSFWPAFNVADAAITAGVLWTIMVVFKSG